jgi:elongation factor P
MDTSDFKKGVSLIYDNNLFTITDFQHVKPGKGGAFVRSTLKNLRTGASVDRTWRAGEKVEQAILDRTTMQYLYTLDDEVYLMDNETFEQISVPLSRLGSQAKYLKEDIELSVVQHNGEVISLEVPSFLILAVVETEPNFKGDTASGGTKPATVEGGAVVQVPFFISVGDKLRIDTRTDTYLERSK